MPFWSNFYSCNRSTCNLHILDSDISARFEHFLSWCKRSSVIICLALCVGSAGSGDDTVQSFREKSLHTFQWIALH